MPERATRWPVYVLSKNRAALCLTARMLVRDGIPFRLCVEEPQADEYRVEFGDHVEVVPFVDEGPIVVRNWIWEHARALGAERHWCLDDNIRAVQRWHDGHRNACDSFVAFREVEEFVDRYTNIGLAGMNYVMFASGTQPPFLLNTRVYSCLLIRNDLPVRWRGSMNSDTDLSLQVLSLGECTVLFNAFLVEKITTMKMTGGNTERYQGDGRLAMARELESRWPGVVEVKRRYNRPQHVVRFGPLGGFDTKLIRRDDIDWDAIEARTVPMAQRRTRPPRKNRTFKT